MQLQSCTIQSIGDSNEVIDREYDVYNLPDFTKLIEDLTSSKIAPSQNQSTSLNEDIFLNQAISSGQVAAPSAQAANLLKNANLKSTSELEILNQENLYNQYTQHPEGKQVSAQHLCLLEKHESWFSMQSNRETNSSPDSQAASNLLDFSPANFIYSNKEDLTEDNNAENLASLKQEVSSKLISSLSKDIHEVKSSIYQGDNISFVNSKIQFGSEVMLLKIAYRNILDTNQQELHISISASPDLHKMISEDCAKEILSMVAKNFYSKEEDDNKLTFSEVKDKKIEALNSQKQFKCTISIFDFEQLSANTENRTSLDEAKESTLQDAQENSHDFNRLLHTIDTNDNSNNKSNIIYSHNTDREYNSINNDSKDSASNHEVAKMDEVQSASEAGESMDWRDREENVRAMQLRQIEEKQFVIGLSNSMHDRKREREYAGNKEGKSDEDAIVGIVSISGFHDQDGVFVPKIASLSLFIERYRQNTASYLENALRATGKSYGLF